LYHIHPSTSFPPISPLLLPSTLGRTCSALLLSNFVEEKRKWHFCLFKIGTQGVSLWHFHVFMYCSPNWFISIFLHSPLVLFLWWFLLVEKFYINSCIKSISTLFSALISFFYSFSLSLFLNLSLVWPVFYNIAVFVLGLCSTYVKLCSFWPFEPSPVPFIYLQMTNFHSFWWLKKIPLHMNTTFS
jgi:hypothetical protein